MTRHHDTTITEFYQMNKNVTTHGKVTIGKGTVVQENVVLGHREDGETIIVKIRSSVPVA